MLSIPQPTPYGVIYTITNKLNGKQYVGQTTRPILERWMEHVSDAINKKRHGCRVLHNAICKYGSDAFSVEAIITCGDQDELNQMEMMAIYTGKTLSPNGYNLAMGGNGGGRLGAEARAKMSESRKGIKRGPFSTEHRARISAAMKGKKRGPRSLEHRAKLSAALKGRPPSPATIAAHKGKHRSPETRAKISAAKNGKAGHPQSQDTRRKISEANRGGKGSFCGRRHSEETRRKMSEAAKHRREKQHAECEHP